MDSLYITHVYMVELVEVTEGVLEPSDHLGILDPFFEIVNETCFKCSF